MHVQGQDVSEHSEPQRRRGDRRRGSAPVSNDQRAGDRRVNKPGLDGLVRTLLGS